MFNENKIYKIDKNGNKKEVLFIKGLKIRFHGKNSTIIVHEPFAKFKRCRITCENNSFVEIGASEYIIKKLNLFIRGENSKVLIGRNFSVTNTCEVVNLTEKNLSLKIGDDCMFGSNILIRLSDGHSVLDMTTGEHINCGKNVEIGNHVWIASDTKILKGAKISDNSIVATGSIVTDKKFPSNVILAGVPVKVVKTGINWDRKSV